MSSMKKFFLTIISLIMLLLTGGALYINYWLDNLITEINTQPALVTTAENQEPTPQESPQPTQGKDAPVNKVESAPVNKGASAPVSNESKEKDKKEPEAQLDTKAPSKAEPSSSNQVIANSVQEQLDKPIEKSDLIEAGIIILSKLSQEEINFMFGFSDKSYSNEDLKAARAILLSKLSEKEIRTLRALGQKYGKKLEILDASVEIK